MPKHEATGKWIATEYREHSTKYDPDEVELSDLQAQFKRGHDVLEVDYYAPNGQLKSVRGNRPEIPGGVMNEPEREGLVFGHGPKYHLTPEGELRTAPYKDTGQRLAEPEDVLKITGVDFPSAVPTEGAVQEGVTATVFYRSNRSGSVNTVDVNVDHMDGHASKFSFSGYEADDDRRFEVSNCHERILKRKGRHETTLGRVVRVEFPAGHQFTVKAKNLTDEGAERVSAERVKEELQSLMSSSHDEADVELEVTHDGRIQG
jgi:hypothetical protein